MTTFSFQDQMKMSEGISAGSNIEEVILSDFPTAIKVERATNADDRQGTDYWVTMQSGEKVSIDVKVRKDDWSKTHPDEDDIALETWSSIGEKVGWTRDVAKRTDYILWLWLETGRWMLVPFPMLCRVFCENWEKWRKNFRCAIQTTKNTNGSQWKSECVFVPRRLVWTEMYDHFGGAPIKRQRQVNLQSPLSDGVEKAATRNYHNPKGGL